MWPLSLTFRAFYGSKSSPTIYIASCFVHMCVLYVLVVLVYYFCIITCLGCPTCLEMLITLNLGPHVWGYLKKKPFACNLSSSTAQMIAVFLGAYAVSNTKYYVCANPVCDQFESVTSPSKRDLASPSIYPPQKWRDRIH